MEILKTNNFSRVYFVFCFRHLFWFMLFLSFPFFMFVSCLFHVGFRLLCVSPFGVQFGSIFLLWNSCFHFLSLFIFLGLWIMHGWALGTRTCRSVHTKKLADHPQFWHETNENRSKDDNRRWENHITIKMKQNDKNDSPKSVADTFSNFSKQINGYAGLTQARNREKTCKSSRVKAKWIWSGKKTGNSTKCWALKPDWQKYAFIV